MPSHVALLRAVNLGQHNRVGMKDLRDLAGELGFAEPGTLLQSGNLIFSGGTQRPVELERILERGARERLGLETDFFVRNRHQMRDLIAANPYPEQAKNDPAHLVVVFLKEEPDSESVRALEKAIVGREMVQAIGRELFVVYPDGIGRSKLGMTSIEKKLRTRGTGRNWNTVLKLGEALG